MSCSEEAPHHRALWLTQPHCPPCDAIEAFPNSEAVRYITRDVIDDPTALDAIAREGLMSTLVTRAGDQWLVALIALAGTRVSATGLAPLAPLAAVRPR